MRSLLSGKKVEGSIFDLEGFAGVWAGADAKEVGRKIVNLFKFCLLWDSSRSRHELFCVKALHRNINKTIKRIKVRKYANNLKPEI